MKYVIAGIVLVVAALLAWTLARTVDMPGIHVPGTGPAAADGMSSPAGTGYAAPSVAGSADALADITDMPLDPDAIASLRGAREFGDPRTPPIERSAPAEQATPEELADPARYAEFEARQERKMKRAYVIEAERYVSQLRDDVARARTMDIPAEEIAKVEEKIRRIEAMRQQLLAQDPGLLEAPAGQ